MLSVIRSLLCVVEVVGEMGERAAHRQRREAAHGAERAIGHHLAQVDERGDVGVAVGVAGDDLVDQLHAADAADATRRALAARFDRAELHCEASLRRHVDRVVEHDDAAVAEQRVGSGERLVVHRQVEPIAGQVRAERATDLDGAHRAAAGCAAAEIVDQFAQRDAERGLDDAAASDVAGQLEHLRAAAAADAQGGVRGRAVGHDRRHGAQADARC